MSSVVFSDAPGAQLSVAMMVILSLSHGPFFDGIGDDETASCAERVEIDADEKWSAEAHASEQQQ
ncbi:hypothetical protein [Aquabacter cavernae]|uniref:hypothetical protein n=1 Tax=Aquabacter cavernae TaxID=2496029 RepID=UPI0013DFCB53|nr:hypothetical protein [Aquabacter cavernae]